MNPAENPWPPHMEEAPPPAPVATPTPARSIDVKNPLLAAFLSLFPGLGHIYNGLYLRGVTFFVVFFSLIALADRANNPIFGFAAVFFGLFNVIDTYRQAVLINYGYAQDLGLLDRPKAPRPGQGGLAAGLALTVIGALAIADRYLNVDIAWILDLWPFALVLIGVWLIWGAIRERSRRAAS
jgi:hypothetical protein